MLTEPIGVFEPSPLISVITVFTVPHWEASKRRLAGIKSGFVYAHPAGSRPVETKIDLFSCSMIGSHSCYFNQLHIYLRTAVAVDFWRIALLGQQWWPQSYDPLELYPSEVCGTWDSIALLHGRDMKQLCTHTSSHRHSSCTSHIGASRRNKR